MRKLLIFSLIFSGCATYTPIIDMQGVNHDRYRADLSDCQQYAQQIDVAGSAATSAAAGAALGAILGAILGGRNRGIDVGRTAAASGALSAAGGAAHAGQSQINIVRNCMAQRGYRVLH